MKNYLVNVREKIDHNGERYIENEKISLSADDAERLLNLGVIVELAEEEPTVDVDPPDVDPEPVVNAEPPKEKKAAKAKNDA